MNRKNAFLALFNEGNIIIISGKMMSMFVVFIGAQHWQNTVNLTQNGRQF